MKKLLKAVLLIFTISLFISCGDDDNNGDWTSGFDNWNSKESPNYKPTGYNPILGTWVKDGSIDIETKHYTHRYTFSEDFKFQESYYKEEYKRWGDYYNLANYIINDKEFKIDTKYVGVNSNKIYSYKIEIGDGGQKILYIKFSGNTYTKYYEYNKDLHN